MQKVQMFLRYGSCEHEAKGKHNPDVKIALNGVLRCT